MKKITGRRVMSFIVGITVLIGYGVLVPYGPILFSGCKGVERVRTEEYPEIEHDDGEVLRTRIDCLVYDKPGMEGQVIWELPAGYPASVLKRRDLVAGNSGWIKIEMERFSRPDIIGWVRLTRRID